MRLNQVEPIRRATFGGRPSVVGLLLTLSVRLVKLGDIHRE